MFCSKCGMTIPAEAAQCPSCGHAVGESRFEGTPYTSAQAHIRPGSGDRLRGLLGVDPHEAVTQNYTRTNYTSMGDEADQGDADARTTYRPLYDGTSAPEEIRRDMRAALKTDEAEDEPGSDEQPEGRESAPAEEAFSELSQEAQEAIDNVDEQLKMDGVDLSKFRARPITTAGQPGISADVSDFIQKIESEAPRRGILRRTPEDAEVQTPAETTMRGIDDEQPAVFDDIDEEEFEELRHSGVSPKQIVKLAVALVAVAALFVGGVMWIRYIRSNRSNAPIPNVDETLYNNGVALMVAHASAENIAETLGAYSAADGGLTALTARLRESAEAVDALTPEEPTDNEKLFLNALDKIETNIANCITSDALAVSANDAEAMEKSDERWAVVENAIAVLQNAKSAGELTAIINGEEVDIAQINATASPTPPPNYNTLSKGDKSDEVFEMQTRLYELGFFLEERDGAFGGKTQTAVKMFQQAAGLAITGIADNETLTAIYADDAPRTEFAVDTAGAQ